MVVLSNFGLSFVCRLPMFRAVCLPLFWRSIIIGTVFWELVEVQHVSGCYGMHNLGERRQVHSILTFVVLWKFLPKFHRLHIWCDAVPELRVLFDAFEG